MPIVRLPSKTSRLLGCSLTISSPVILVKELVENAIDARATSVDVIISENTVDKIEVRDNGLGIHAGDFGALGRRGHTSKLRSYEELRDGRITTLGFRGEALAATNAVGEVRITTRTGKDAVATLLELQHGNSSAISRGLVSAPVGTTVIVSRLFAQLPVREKLAIKEASHAIPTIKRLLYSYALANPHLRLTFKIPKHSKLSWSYSPHLGAQVREAVLQIFGTELASQCQEMIVKSDAASETDGTPHDSVIEIYLPKPQAELSKINHGAFVSINARPLCSNRGIRKKLISIYHRHFFQAVGGSQGQRVKEPFIVLNIKCPAGSYDPNVEPSKNDVLFADEPALLGIFENFCEAAYATAAVKVEEPPEIDLIPSTAVVRSGDPVPRVSAASTGRGEQTLSDLLPRDGPAGGRTEQDLSCQLTVSALDDSCGSGPTRKSRAGPKWTVNMSAPVDSSSDDDDSDNQEPRAHNHQNELTSQIIETEHVRGDVLGSLNPWSIAMMNAPRRDSNPSAVSPAQQLVPSGLRGQDGRPGHAVWENTGDRLDEHSAFPNHRNLSPWEMDISSSRPPALSQLESFGRRPPSGLYRSPLSSPAGLQHPRSLPEMLSPVQDNHQVVIGLGTPPSSAARRPYQRPRVSKPQPQPQPAFQDHAQSLNMSGDGFRQSRLALADGRANRNQRRVDPEDISMGGTERTAVGRDPVHSWLAEQVNAENADRVQPGFLLSSEDISFERSRMLQRRDTTLTRPPPAASPGRPTPSDGLEGALPIQTGLSEEDSRRYLMRRQKSMEQLDKKGRRGTLRRMKTELLPLETVGRHFQTQDVVQELQVQGEGVSKAGSYLSWFDQYILTGKVAEGLDMSMGADVVEEIAHHLREVLAAWTGDGEKNDSLEVENLRIALQKRMKGKQTVVRAW